MYTLTYPPELGLWTFRDKLREAHIKWEEFTRENQMSFLSEGERKLAERLMYNCLSGLYLNPIKRLDPKLRKFVAHLFV